MPIVRICGSCGRTLELIGSNHFPRFFSIPKICPGCKLNLAPPDFERVQVTPIDPGTPWVLSS
jgi:hypothetical protein